MTSDRSKTSLSSKNNTENNYAELLSQPPLMSDDKGSFGDRVQESIRTNSKLKDFLVKKYYSPETASNNLELVTYHHSRGNDDFFEKQLNFLRNFDNPASNGGNSFDNYGARKARLEMFYPGADPNLSLPKLDSNDLIAEHKQAKGKLMEIEGV